MMAEEESAAVVDNAVQVSGIYKSYGHGKKKALVLKDLDMMVPRGNIYGLLGPSGCGKTTLLRCILGRLQIEEGDIRALGAKPGSKGHGVPGKMVGYMPQELALYNKFTVGETLSYFGRLHKMTRDRVRERTTFLLDFLSLPGEDRQIEQLSGGQQRRTSFAIALLQEPELLILDEPTVGVDPLLRQRIWEHMLEIATSGNVTIIITTHYVEEARQAHMVGLMRNGRMLAEAPPGDLMEAYEVPCLEDVFQTLCEHDQKGDIYHSGGDEGVTSGVLALRARTRARKSDMQHNSELAELLCDEEGNETRNSGCAATCRKCVPFHLSLTNILALFIKNMLNLRRNIGFLLFEFFLPSLQITLFCLCIGRAPYGLKFGVVNNETCSSTLFPCASQLYIQSLSNETLQLEHRGHDFLAVYNEVKQGKSWGFINIGENFTIHLIKRFQQGPLDNETIEGSTVHAYLDMTNQQISFTIQQTLLEGFQKFAQEQLSKYGLNPASAEIPIKMETPIYGDSTPSFTNFMAPGIIISVTFFMATGLTALSFVLERKQGLMDRSFVAGVNTVEIMIGHICTQFLVMCVQVGLLLVFAMGIFSVPYEGPLILVIILALLQGLIGMALGLLISTLCTEETSAIQCSLAMVYPNLLLSGIIWPLEAMPTWLRYISYGLPMTFAAEAMRSILARGWTLLYMPVWRGFLVSIGWGWALMSLSALVLAIRGE